MASAKEYAIKQLGNLDLGYLDKEKSVAKNVYDTSKKAATTGYGQTMEDLARSGEQYKKQFDTGRATIAESAYDKNRLNNIGLASRVSGKTGLKDLARLGNRMETGKEFSDLANVYYGNKEELDISGKRAGEQQELGLEGLKNIYDQSMAGIGTRGAEARNQYGRDVANLSESVQGRWDSAAQAAAARAQAERFNAQDRADKLAAAQEEYSSQRKQDLASILSNPEMGYQDAFNIITDTYGANADTINRLLANSGFTGAPTETSFGYSDPVKQTAMNARSRQKYIDEILGVN